MKCLGGDLTHFPVLVRAHYMTSFSVPVPNANPASFWSVNLGAHGAQPVRGAPHSLTPRFVRTKELHDRARIRVLFVLFS